MYRQSYFVYDMRRIIASAIFLTALIAITTLWIFHDIAISIGFSAFIFYFVKGISLVRSTGKWNAKLYYFINTEEPLLSRKTISYYQNSYLEPNYITILDPRFWNYRDLIADKILLHEIENYS